MIPKNVNSSGCQCILSITILGIGIGVSVVIAEETLSQFEVIEASSMAWNVNILDAGLSFGEH